MSDTPPSAFGELLERITDRVFPKDDASTHLPKFWQRFLVALSGAASVIVISLLGRAQSFAQSDGRFSQLGQDMAIAGLRGYFQMLQSSQTGAMSWLILVSIVVFAVIYSVIIALSLPKRGPTTLLIAGAAIPILILSLGKIAIS
ncbi:MAG: hypothetical protein ACXIVD_14545 [Salinarimonas sp.]